MKRILTMIAVALAIGCGSDTGDNSSTVDAGEHDAGQPDSGDTDTGGDVYAECEDVEDSMTWSDCVGEDAAIAEQDRVQEEVTRRNAEQVDPVDGDRLEGCETDSPQHFCTLEPGDDAEPCGWDVGLMGDPYSRPVPVCTCGVDFDSVREDICGSE